MPFKLLDSNTAFAQEVASENIIADNQHQNSAEPGYGMANFSIEGVN